MEAADKELHRLEDHANEDALSRLPIGSDPNFDKQESIVEIDSEVNILDKSRHSQFAALCETRRRIHQKGSDSGKGATLRYEWVAIHVAA